MLVPGSPGHDPHPSHVLVPMAKGPDPGPVGRGPLDRLEAAGLRILALRGPASCVLREWSVPP